MRHYIDFRQNCSTEQPQNRSDACLNHCIKISYDKEYCTVCVKIKNPSYIESTSDSAQFLMNRTSLFEMKSETQPLVTGTCSRKKFIYIFLEYTFDLNLGLLIRHFFFVFSLPWNQKSRKLLRKILTAN